MTTSPPTLEELFLRHYGEDIATPAGDLSAEVVAAR
jgi:ABC-2 type transport system ATP-binding protein